MGANCQIPEESLLFPISRRCQKTSKHMGRHLTMLICLRSLQVSLWNVRLEICLSMWVEFQEGLLLVITDFLQLLWSHPKSWRYPWRWLPHRLLNCQSPPTTVLIKTPLNWSKISSRSIKMNIYIANLVKCSVHPEAHKYYNMDGHLGIMELFP